MVIMNESVRFNHVCSLVGWFRGLIVNLISCRYMYLTMISSLTIVIVVVLGFSSTIVLSWCFIRNQVEP
jgi:hypothetical protein